VGVGGIGENVRVGGMGGVVVVGGTGVAAEQAASPKTTAPATVKRISVLFTVHSPSAK